MGRAFIDGQTAARGWYDAVFNQPATLVPSLIALLVFAAATPIMSTHWPPTAACPGGP